MFITYRWQMLVTVITEWRKKAGKSSYWKEGDLKEGCYGKGGKRLDKRRLAYRLHFMVQKSAWAKQAQRSAPCKLQAATTHPWATCDSAEDPPKRCSTASLPNRAQLVLISIHTLHGPDRSELLSVNKISISQLSVREGDPCSDPGCQSSSLYKHLLLLPFIGLCIFQWNPSSAKKSQMAT